MVRFASCESDCPVLLGGSGLLRQYIRVLLRNRGDPSPRPCGHFPAPPAMLGTANGAGLCTNPCIPALCDSNRLRQQIAGASNSFCGRMPPKWGPCGAARGRRKSPKGGAQDARQFVARTRMCAQRTPQPPREVAGQDARRPRYSGWPSLWLLSLGHARESNSLARRASESTALQQARSTWIPPCAGMTAGARSWPSA